MKGFGPAPLLDTGYHRLYQIIALVEEVKEHRQNVDAYECDDHLLI